MRETITPIKWLRWRFSPGREVNLIPQLFGGAQYPRPGVGRDAAVVAQRPGHHCPGDARSPGNIPGGDAGFAWVHRRYVSSVGVGRGSVKVSPSRETNKPGHG